MKKIFAFARGTFKCDTNYYAVILNVSKEMISQIAVFKNIVSEICKNNNEFYGIIFWNKSCDWYSSHPDSGFDEEDISAYLNDTEKYILVNCEYVELPQSLPEINAVPLQMEQQQMFVTPKGIYFRAIIKNTDIICETSLIHFSEIC